MLSKSKKIIFVALLLAVSGCVTAKGKPKSATYGAVAYSASTGAWGMRWKFRSMKAAHDNALLTCNKYDCSVTMTFGPGTCASVATGANKAIGWAKGNTFAQAKQTALAQCLKRSKNCTERRTACNI